MANNKNVSVVIIINLVVLIIVLGSVIMLTLEKFTEYDGYERKSFINKELYQAILLTNDQLYFGHLKNIDKDYLILSDVYYIKVNNDGTRNLVKLGEVESYGPENSMTINKEQVLFWENLKFDSPVVKTIQNM